jgi:hypothetical protein
VQCLEWLLGRTYNYTLKTRITTTTIIRWICQADRLAYFVAIAWWCQEG